VSDTQRLAAVILDEQVAGPRDPDIEQERRVAIQDLLEQNTFAPAESSGGPYRLYLSVEDSSIVLDVRSEADVPVSRVLLPLSPFRRIIKDYRLICDSYFDAIKDAPPARVETLDMGRRGVHNEGADLLIEKLRGRVAVDFETARRLFTLLCVLQARK
jgi:uncharacterized protein (UPF0262 family)